MKAIRFLCIVSIIFSIFQGRLSAEDKDPHIQVNAEVDRAFTTIGDPIQYVLKISHSPDYTINRIDSSEAWRDFEVKNDKKSQKKEGNLLIDVQETTLISFALGEYVLAPIKVIYSNSGGEVKEALSNALYVTVESVDKGQKASEDIAGVKGVVSFSYRRWFWILVSLLVIAGLGGYWWYKNREKITLFKPRDLSLPPHEEAYRALHELMDSDLLKRQQYKTYYFLLSQIIKHYLERRFQILAAESTTSELMMRLREIDLEGDNRNLIKNLMDSSDLVKFAKYIPEIPEIQKHNSTAKEIIDKTKPIVISEITPPVNNHDAV